MCGLTANIVEKALLNLICLLSCPLDNKFSLGLDAVLESTTLINRKTKSKTQSHNDACSPEPLQEKKKQKLNPNNNNNKKTPTTKQKVQEGGARSEIFFSE